MSVSRILYCVVLIFFMISCREENSGVGIRAEYFDTTVIPGDNFFQYACGGWVRNNPIQPESSGNGSLNGVMRVNKERVRDIIYEVLDCEHPWNSNNQKICDLYNIFLDSVGRESEGYTPIISMLDRVSSANDRDRLFQIAMEMYIEGVRSFMDVGFAADHMDSRRNILTIRQNGLSLPDRSYYLGNDDRTVMIREKFKEHLIRINMLTGLNNGESVSVMESVMALETRMAKVSYSQVELRDPKKNYNRISVEDFITRFSQMNWTWFFNLISLSEKSVDYVNVSQTLFVNEIGSIFATAPIEQIRDYLRWRVIDSYSYFLNESIYQESFNFHQRVLKGNRQMPTKWQRAVNFVDNVLGDAVGELYVIKYFPQDTKECVSQMVESIKEAFAERISVLDWMDDSTKNRAIVKLNAINVKVGYPDKWRDYSGMKIDKTLSLVENIRTINKFYFWDSVERRVGKPVDRREWRVSPQTVNAYYSRSTNEICIPAGILQHPFFDIQADNAFNYGAIGVVIGHEISHGFDDVGSLFDGNGNLSEWWSSQDREYYIGEVDKLAAYFNSIEILPGLYVDGNLTLGENIADQAGLIFAYRAMQNIAKNDSPILIDGFSSEQRFFMAYAGVWASAYSENEIRRRLVQDPHQIGYWRVNGTLPNIEEWYNAFNVKPADSLYLRPENRIRIW